MKFTLNRRDFLQTLSLLGTALYCGESLATSFIKLPEASPYLVSADNAMIYSDMRSRSWEGDLEGLVKIYDLQLGTVETHAVPVLAHVYEQHPVQTNLLVGAGRKSPHAVVFDLKNKNVVTKLTAPLDLEFYGHVTFDPAGELAYFTMIPRYVKTEGAICVYDCKTWELTRRFPSGACFPHDCTILPTGELMVVHTFALTTRALGQVNLIDRKTSKVIRRYEVPKTSHQLYGEDGLFLSGWGDGPSNLIRLDLKSGQITDFLKSSGLPQKPLYGEALSLCRLSPSQVAVTIPSENRVAVWDYKAMKVQFVSANKPVLGMTRFKDRIFVNTAGKALFDFDSNRVPNNFYSSLTNFASGRHTRLVYT